MLFLPEYYGIEFSYSLPVLTVARIMFVVLFIYAILNRRRPLSLKGIHIKTLPLQYKLLTGYFLFRIVSNIYYLTTYSSAIKTIFEIVFEQFFLLYAIYLLAPTKEEINTLIKAVVWVSCFMFIIGIFESLTSIRPFDALFTVTRPMANQHFIRLGLMRSTTTMGLCVLYGNMCLLIFPLIVYLYNTTGQRRYLSVVFFDILATIHSGSRADLLFFFVIVFFYFIIIVCKSKKYREFFINTLAIIGVLILTMTTLSLCSDKYRYYYTGTIKSTLNEIGFDFDLTQGMPEGVDGFGSNDDNGTASRTVQFTGMAYVASINPIFGLGSQPLSREAVYYYSDGKWHIAKAFDVGIVEVFCSEGLIGIIAHLLLYISLLLPLIKKRGIKNMPLCYRYSLLSILTYLVCMLCTANMYYFLFLYVILNNSAVSIIESETDH